MTTSAVPETYWGLVDAVADAMRRGLNQYPPMTGVAALREAVAQKIERLT